MVKNVLATVANWRTTTIAILQALVVVFGAVVNMIDLDPATVADWNKVIVALAAALSSIGLWQAADAAEKK